jgi:hypothetical protein
MNILHEAAMVGMFLCASPTLQNSAYIIKSAADSSSNVIIYGYF